MQVTKILDERRTDAFRQIKSLEKEIVDLIRLRDEIKTDIEDQRRWKNEVLGEKGKLVSEVEKLENMISHIRVLANKKQSEFYEMTSKQRESIIELASDITEKSRERQEYKEKEKTIIDIDAVNRGHKERIQAFNKEISLKEADLKNIKDEKMLFIKQLEQKENELLLKDKYLKQREEKLKHRENDQDMREKRRKDSSENRKKFINLKKN